VQLSHGLRATSTVFDDPNLVFEERPRFKWRQGTEDRNPVVACLSTIDA
jgi:hypothetical protein